MPPEGSVFWVHGQCKHLVSPPAFEKNFQTRLDIGMRAQSRPTAHWGPRGSPDESRERCLQEHLSARPTFQTREPDPTGKPFSLYPTRIDKSTEIPSLVRRRAQKPRANNPVLQRELGITATRLQVTPAQATLARHKNANSKFL